MDYLEPLKMHTVQMGSGLSWRDDDLNSKHVSKTSLKECRQDIVFATLPTVWSTLDMQEI